MGLFLDVPSFILGWTSYHSGVYIGAKRAQICQWAESATKQLSPIIALVISNILPPQHLRYVYPYTHIYIYVASKGRGVFRIHTP